MKLEIKGTLLGYEYMMPDGQYVDVSLRLVRENALDNTPWTLGNLLRNREIIKIVLEEIDEETPKKKRKK